MLIVEVPMSYDGKWPEAARYSIMRTDIDIKRDVEEELRSNPEQIANSEYARTFQRGKSSDPTVVFGRPMTPETLSGGGRDPAARAPTPR